MDVLTLTAVNMLFISLAGNIIQYYKYKNRPGDKTYTYDVRELLRDLASGEAKVAFRRVDPSHEFERSPRHIN